MTKAEIALEIFKIVNQSLKIATDEDPAQKSAKQFNVILENLDVKEPQP